MPDWGMGLRTGPMERGPAPTLSVGASVTSGAAHTKGSWVTLIAAAARQAYNMFLGLQIQGGTATEILMDIGVGAAGSEQIEVSNLYVSKGGLPRGMMLSLPIKVAAGQRVAARQQSIAASAVTNVTAYLAGGSPDSISPYDDAEGIGVITATTRAGVTLDGGASANTKSAYGQLIASTARAYRGFYVLGGNGVAARVAGTSFAVDIAFGAAAAEQIVVPDLMFNSTANEELNPPAYGPFWHLIPSGTRLAARAMAASATAADRTIDISILGVY